MGSFINVLGRGLVTVFLTLYIRERFGVSLAEIGLVLTVRAIAGLASGILGGLLTDRLGRKPVMLISLASSALVLVLLGFASSFLAVAALAVALGLTSPLFGPPRDAMTADLTEPRQRTQAYGMMRVAANLGFAIGPAIGGFLAATSYFLSFSFAAGSSLIVFFITLFFVRETATTSTDTTAKGFAMGGFGPVFKDKLFMVFCGLLILTGMVYSQFSTNLPVYMKEFFGLGESYFGWMMATNGAAVVLLQIWVSRKIESWPRLPTMALGAAFYAVGVASIAFMTGFPEFILPVVIYTVGEVIISPVGIAFVSEWAPLEMRGRYMGLMTLAWRSVPYGIGPVLGGAIYDAGLGRELWFFASGLALVAVLGYLLLRRRMSLAQAPAFD